MLTKGQWDTLSNPPAEPRKDDVLFGGDPNDIACNACLNWAASSAEQLYTVGYRDAARLLHDYLVKHEKDLDTLVYPLFFLYRHHVELLLKSLLVAAVAILGRELTGSEKDHLGKHNLKYLWEDLRAILPEVFRIAQWKKLKQDDIEGINWYISELTLHDSSGDAGRYAVSLAAEPSLRRITHINVRGFTKAMEQLSHLLDGLNVAFVGFQEARVEAREREA